MATLNVGIKFSQAISLNETTNAAGTFSTSYTVPAGRYAILSHVYASAGGANGTSRSLDFSVNGLSIFSASIATAATLSQNSLTDANSQVQGLYLAAGQTVTITSQATGTVSMVQNRRIYATEFQNTQ